MPYFFFRWIAWNIEKVEKHGLTTEVVEYVVNHARRPYPMPQGKGKWLVIGRTSDGIAVQVLYVVDERDDIFVIHARPLASNESRRRGGNRE